MKTKDFMSIIDEAVDGDFYEETPDWRLMEELGEYPADEYDEYTFMCREDRS
jgi:hypothetical protein